MSFRFQILSFFFLLVFLFKHKINVLSLFLSLPCYTSLVPDDRRELPRARPAKQQQRRRDAEQRRGERGERGRRRRRRRRQRRDSAADGGANCSGAPCDAACLELDERRRAGPPARRGVLLYICFVVGDVKIDFVIRLVSKKKERERKKALYRQKKKTPSSSSSKKEKKNHVLRRRKAGSNREKTTTSDDDIEKFFFSIRI